MTPLMLLVAITKKVTHLGTIAWDLLIWRINLCVKSSGTDVFTIMLRNYEKKKNGLTLLIAWYNEKWTHFTKAYEQLGAEKAKELIDFTVGGLRHCRGFKRKSRDTWSKSFLNSDVFETFQLIPKHINK